MSRATGTLAGGDWLARLDEFFKCDDFVIFKAAHVLYKVYVLLLTSACDFDWEIGCFTL